MHVYLVWFGQFQLFQKITDTLTLVTLRLYHLSIFWVLTTVPLQLNSCKDEKRRNIEHMALIVSRVVTAIYCTSMLQLACFQNMAVSEHVNGTRHVPL